MPNEKKEKAKTNTNSEMTLIQKVRIITRAEKKIERLRKQIAEETNRINTMRNEIVSHFQKGAN